MTITGNMLSMDSVLKSLARLAAMDAEIPLPDIRLDDGSKLGCTDVHILSISSMGKTASAKISFVEMDSFRQLDGLVQATRIAQKVVANLKTMLQSS